MTATGQTPLVALLTDFGPAAYAGVMKGVVLAHAPRAQLVDLSHAVPPQDIRQGAWLLYSSFTWFPEGTIFLCVVDPGVGTERLAIAARTRRYLFVGPDNGLLWPTLEADGLVEAVALPVAADASATFHGRDVFGPAAGRLAAGTPLEALGTPVSRLIPFAFHRAGREGEIVYVDPFGNAITNLPPLGGRRRYAVEGPGLPVELPWYPHYGAAPAGSLFLVTGSAGTLELSVKNGDAAAAYALRAGMRIRLS
ncbi:MAG TPA: SAM-dependent chlorinase/fluorinase [Limnochordia bacterium]